MRKILKIFSVLLLSLILISCGGSESKEKSISVLIPAEGKTLDTSLLTSNASLTVHGFLTEGLVKVSKEGKIELGLAKEINMSEDGLVYTIKLKDGIKWSDGSDIVADDFAYAIKRALDPNTASEYAYMNYYIKNGQKYNEGKGTVEELGVKVLDDKTLELTLENATPYFEGLLSFTTYLPIKESFVKESGEDYALDKEHLLYSGPYVISEWVPGSYIKLAKNDNYYGKDNIKLDEVTIKYILDTTSALNAFKNDELDITTLTAEQFKEFENADNTHLEKETVISYLVYNMNNDILKNKHIRKALSLSIDKQSIVETVFDNVTSIKTNTFTPAGVGMQGVKDDFVLELEKTGFKGLDLNIEEAKKELELGLKELGLEKLDSLSIITNDATTNTKVVESMQEQWRKNLGIDVKVELMTYKERLNRMHNNDFDIVFTLWGADFLDPINFLDLLYTYNGNNNGKYSNKEYDKLVEDSAKETNKEERVQKLFEMERMIVEEAPILPLFQRQRVYLLNPKLKGVIYPSFGASMLFTYAYLED